jgi:glycosyltransferase involved in cell wall biosynthesis
MGVRQEKIKVIYNAVDLLIKVPARQKPAVPTIVHSNRLTPWKGVAMLIKIVAKLKQRYPDIVFEIIGDGSEKKALQKLAADLNLDKNVIFHGRVSEPYTHQVFARATIFVLNSFYEGFSHAILHAMTVGIPVITTPVGGNPELVQDPSTSSGQATGLLAPYNDEAAWRAAIEKLLADDVLREKLVVNAKESLKKFKWEKTVTETIEVLSSI